MTTPLTVQGALIELKLLDKRITKASHEQVIGIIQGGELPKGFDSIEEVHKEIKASYQSAKDLIARRNALKSAIVVSNATTVVNVAGVTMTVAEAIERKTSIQYDKNLLTSYKNQLAAVNNNVDRYNATIEQRAEDMTKAFTGGDKTKASEAQTFYDNFVENNKATLIDPLKLKKVIDELSEAIDTFEANVDLALSTSNAITVLEV